MAKIHISISIDIKENNETKKRIVAISEDNPYKAACGAFDEILCFLKEKANLSMGGLSGGYTDDDRMFK